MPQIKAWLQCHAWLFMVAQFHACRVINQALTTGNSNFDPGRSKKTPECV